MNRKELIKSEEYWTAQIQLNLFELIENYRKKNNLSKTELAAQLGVSKSYVTQILNGDFDHKMSKLIGLALAFGKVPVFKFIDVETYIEQNDSIRAKGSSVNSNPPQLKKTFKNTGSVKRNAKARKTSLIPD
ncbi:MAG TPA: helix-turn-helix transcriptional regulator [Hanamia sp.]